MTCSRCGFKWFLYDQNLDQNLAVKYNEPRTHVLLPGNRLYIEFPRAAKDWTNVIHVGNYAYILGDFHGNSSTKKNHSCGFENYQPNCTFNTTVIFKKYTHSVLQMTDPSACLIHHCTKYNVTLHCLRQLMKK